jgi:hypothetical protein
MALAVTQGSTALAMVSMARRGLLLVEVEDTILVLRGTSWLGNLAARLMIGTMVRGSSSLRISGLILDSSIEVRISTIIIAMEVISNTVLGIMGTTISMPIIDMDTMLVDPILISIAIVEEETMIQ